MNKLFLKNGNSILFFFLFSDMVRTIDLKPSKDSTIIDFSTNCRCQMTQNLLNVFCSKIAVHQQFLGDRSEKCLFTSTPNAMSKHLTPDIVRPTMADQSSWMYGKSSRLRRDYIFRISAQEIIDVESIKIMATNFCFSSKMIPTLPSLPQLKTHQCEEAYHIFYSTWKFDKENLRKFSLVTHPNDRHTPYRDYCEYCPYEITEERRREFYITTRLCFCA